MLFWRAAEVNEQIFVSSSSDPTKVAGYIASCMREATLGRLCVTAAGPQPMLRALKAIYLGRHYLQDDGLDLSVVPEFGKSEDGALRHCDTSVSPVPSLDLPSGQASHARVVAFA